MEARLWRVGRERREVLARRLALHAIEADRQARAGLQRGDDVGRFDRDVDGRAVGRLVAVGADAEVGGPGVVGARFPSLGNAQGRRRVSHAYAGMPLATMPSPASEASGFSRQALTTNAAQNAA